mmetsp:Transcript_2259/g.7167  ORF Transcript_2259/g.7167 Transcript_2259/m.7167 type:complete len:433 (-) Transcript_2259:788-2086(-)
MEASSARHRSPITPTATEQTWCCSWFCKPRMRKGRKCGMYFSNWRATPLATAPTAINASSCTVAFFELKTSRKSCISRSAKATTSEPSFCTTTCSVPHSKPCSSFCSSLSSAETICIEKVRSSLSHRYGTISRKLAIVSVADCESTVLSASKDDERKLFSAESARSVVWINERTISRKYGESCDDCAPSATSRLSARLWIAQHTLHATRGSSRSASRSTPPGLSSSCVYVVCMPGAMVLRVPACRSHTRPIVHAAVSRTCTDVSRINVTITGTACVTSGSSTALDGPSSTEPNARSDASRNRHSVDWMFVWTNSITCCTTLSLTAIATSARHVPAAMATFHASSSWSSSCFVSVWSSSGTRYGIAPLTKWCESASGDSPVSRASSSSSCSWISSSLTVDQNSTACCATSSRPVLISSKVSWKSACMYAERWW